MLIRGWTLEIYHERYQDLLSAYQHLVFAICSPEPAHQLDWVEYHLNRTTQGWPKTWKAGLVHENFSQATLKLIQISMKLRLDEEGKPELLSRNRSVVLFQHGEWTWRQYSLDSNWQPCDSFEQGCKFFLQTSGNK